MKIGDVRDRPGATSFGHCDFGDQRRTQRLVRMIPHVLANPEGTIAGTLHDDPAAVKAAYRLLDCPRVIAPAVLAPHRPQG